MAFVHGKNAHISVGGTNISQYCTEIGFPRSADSHETTTFGKDNKTYVPGLKDGTISLSGNYDSACDDVLAPALGTIVPFIYGVEGSTAGKRRYTGNAVVTSYEVSEPVGDLVTWSAELQISDAPVRDTF